MSSPCILSTDTSTWSSGTHNAACACSFQVLNQRQPVVFALFANVTRAGNFSEEAIVARSPVIHFASYDEPTQGHLALTSDPTCANATTDAASCEDAFRRS